MKVIKFKRDTQLVIISVLILTLVTMRVSYSAFFSVQSKNVVEQISAGTLDIAINSNSTPMSAEELFPTDSNDLPTTETSRISETYSYSRIILDNTGTLPAEYALYLTYNNVLPAGKTIEDLIGFNYLYVGIYDVGAGKWVNFGDENATAYYMLVSSIEPSDTNTYPILGSSTLNALASKEYRVYVWLSQNTPATEIGKLVYLKLEVKSRTVNGHVES